MSGVWYDVEPNCRPIENETKQCELPHQGFYVIGISLRTCISVPDVLAYPDSRLQVDFAKSVAYPSHLHTNNDSHPDELTMDELYDVSDSMSRLRHPLTLDPLRARNTGIGLAKTLPKQKIMTSNNQPPPMRNTSTMTRPPLTVVHHPRTTNSCKLTTLVHQTPSSFTKTNSTMLLLLSSTARTWRHWCRRKTHKPYSNLS